MVDAAAAAALGLRERKKQRTRAMLIDAAIELCDRQGFERTTVDQIAAVADVEAGGTALSREHHQCGAGPAGGSRAR